MSALDRIKFFRTNPKMKIPLNLGTPQQIHSSITNYTAALIGSIFVTSLPAATALFPQQSTISVDKLEPQFQNLKNSKGTPIQTVYYNKGL